MTADITLRGPGDVLAVLPYQLGYHPRSCVVAVALRGRTVGLVARTDLPPDEHVAQGVAALVGPLQRDGATAVIAVGYEDEPDASQPALVALVDQLEGAGVEVVDVVVVRDGRRYSPLCSEPCCPPEGVALPEPADVPAVAELVARGRVPLASRHDVEGLVLPHPVLGAGVAHAVAVRSRMPRRRRRAAVAWSVLLRPQPGPEGPPGRRTSDRRASRGSTSDGGALGSGALGPGALGSTASGRGASAGGAASTGASAGAMAGRAWRPQLVADAAVGLADIALRDGLVAWLAPGVLPMSLVDRQVVSLLHATLPTWAGMGVCVSTEARAASGRVAHDLDAAGERRALLYRLLDLCRALPDECPAEAAAVCTVAAHVAWVEGDGALARAAVDRALRLDPDYRLAQLLLRLVESGLRLPRRDEDSREEGRPDDEEGGSTLSRAG